MLENQQKLAQTYQVFLDKVTEYFDRTADPRAAALLAREKILLGDEYMSILSRYEKALEMYRKALEIDPGNADAAARIALAEKRRYVSMSAFAGVKQGMKEDDVRNLVGLPREDWIKQVVQNNRAYSVWIYPKADGGASAIYFDNGVVYHTNWNAAAPPAR
jgi:tetratricopeptide (TPR) repeat protein